MTTEQKLIEGLLHGATQEIQRSANFFFLGSPRAYMEIDSGGDTKRIVYYVYGYGTVGEPDPTRLVHRLVDDIALALDQLDVSPICIVWRRYPDLQRDHERDGWVCTVRLAVVDRELNQIMLSLPPVEEGGLVPQL